jgi:hypothetical protein
MLETAVVDVPSLDGGNEVWVECLPARIYHTPNYGEVQVTKDKLARMVQNFNARVRGQDISTDFDHGMDRAKGNQASGWYREMTLRPSSTDPTQPSLFARIELTDDAAREIKQKKWRYFSLEWLDDWLDNNGRTHLDVVTGGAFTNKPVAKNIMPINLSESMWEELDYETKKQFAVWSTAFVNNLPDSAFLYVQSGGSKDKDGRTVPRTLRHFPYKDGSGKVDLPHLRNAIARIPQAGSWLSAAMKTSLQSRARRLLGGNSKAMSEGAAPAVREAYELLTEYGYDVMIPSDTPGTEVTADVTDESKELEHSEPGQGSPPPPRQDGDGSDDPAITEHWRQTTPPDQDADPPVTSNEAVTPPVPPLASPAPGTVTTTTTTVTPDKTGGKMTPEQEFELRNILGISADGDIIEASKLQLGELTELRRNVDAATQERKFAEEYPAFWGEHNKLMNRDRDNSARQFSESVARVRKAEGFGLKETAKGLSSMSLSKIKDLHMHFAEGTATIEEYEDVIRTIVNGGIVEFGELGSSATDNDIPIIDTSSAPGIAGARKLFAEVVSKVQAENPDKDYRWAMDEAARKHPDLAEAYAVTLPA